MNRHYVLEGFGIEYKSMAEDLSWEPTEEDLNNEMLNNVPARERLEFCTHLYDLVKQIRYNYCDWGAGGISHSNLDEELHQLLDDVIESYERLPRADGPGADEVVKIYFNDDENCWHQMFRRHDCPGRLCDERIARVE